MLECRLTFVTEFDETDTQLYCTISFLQIECMQFRVDVIMCINLEYSKVLLGNKTSFTRVLGIE